MSRIALTLAAFAFAAPLGAQQSGAFVVRLGNDTIIVERFSRSGNAYQVEQALRSPTTRYFHTHVELTPAGGVANVMYMQHQIGGAADAPLLASTQITVSGDSATIAPRRGDSTLATRRVAVPAGTLPTLPSSYLWYELASMRSRATGQDSLTIPLLGPNGRVTYTVKRLGSDSMLFILDPSTVYRAQVDREGHILGMHGPLTTFRIQLARVPSVDVGAYAARWSATPAMGALSPTDSLRASVSGANIGVRYSRPSKRGRVVFGDSGIAIESWGRVWRTGANEATRLTTDKDLVIGGAAVPAGTYTLWTLLDPKGWKLIINKQLVRPDGTGRMLWGTMYDAQYDLARVDMQMATLSSPVEQMTIAIEPQGQGGVLRISWDTYQASVPLSPKP